MKTACETQNKLAFYLQRGLHPIPVKHKDKRPATPDGEPCKDWQNRTYEPQDFTGRATNVGIHLVDGLVDIDLDCPEAVALANVFFPEGETLAFGRASTPLAHRLYIAPDVEYRKITASFGTVLELRTGHGKQTVVPPSVHATGEQLHWLEASPMVPLMEMDGDRLVAGARLLATCAIFAHHWSNGTRDDLAFVFTNLMHRADVSPELIASMLAAICEHANDEEARQRIEKAHKAHKAGRKTGVPTLAKLIGEDAQVVSELLTGKYGLDELLRRIQANPENWLQHFKNADVNPFEAEQAQKLVKKLTGGSMPAIRETLAGKKEQALTHDDMARGWLVSKDEFVSWGGHFWQYADGIYKMLTLEKAQTEVPPMYNQEANCKRRGDYVAIARHGYDIAEDVEFFSNRARGVACSDGFRRIDDDKIVLESHSPEHRARFVLPVAPEEGEPERWLWFLHQCFKGKDEKAQTALLQEILGAVIVGVMYQYEKVAMFYGPGNAGKSTLLRVIEALIPAEYVGASSPLTWDREYNRASLATLWLNIVGELADDKPIPVEFKTVTGRDKIDGRQPNHRVIYFRPEASHLWNTNVFPATRDTSSAFWRRWLVLGFFNSRKTGADDIRDLDAQLIEELPRIVWWALQGAARLLKHNAFTETGVQADLMRRWSTRVDSVAEFITERVRDDKNHSHALAVFKDYKEWCYEVERRPLGRSKFYERMAAHGYEQVKRDGYSVYVGIQIVNGGMPL